MRPTVEGYRVAVVGASSLVGKELLTVLRERRFPASSLFTCEAEDDELGLPILDLTGPSFGSDAVKETAPAEVDFIFVAARPPSDSVGASFLSRVSESGEAGRSNGLKSGSPGSSGPAARGTTRQERCVVIDLDGEAADGTSRVLRIAFLDPDTSGVPSDKLPDSEHSILVVAPHAATIVIGSVLLRLAWHFTLKSAVAQVFSPVSEIGPRAIEELQKQTVNLLSFQKIPKTVFGTQMAFNLLPRIGRKGHSSLSNLESRIRQELGDYLGDRVALPALRLFQVPVFYSLGFSIFVETPDAATPEKLAQALDGGRIRVLRISEQAPSQVETTGTGDILVDSILRDPARPSGFWIWAVVDNLRLAAENAVEIAEDLLRKTKK